MEDFKIIITPTQPEKEENERVMPISPGRPTKASKRGVGTIKTCLQCGKIFSQPKQGKIKRFCSGLCRIRYWRRYNNNQ